MPADGSAEVFKRQDSYVAYLQHFERMGSLAIDLPHKASDSFKSAFETLNNRRLDPLLKAKDRVLYTTDILGFEDFEKAGLTIDLGHISKALGYKPVTDKDYEAIDSMLDAFDSPTRSRKSPVKRQRHGFKEVKKAAREQC
ncbi:MAG: hypothetical protein WB014_13600 [Methanosarcina sp.]